MTREEIVVGLDIGTTKVGTVIATAGANGMLTIVGVGVVPSRGMKRGVIIDVADTVAAIKESVERAAHMAGVKATSVVAGITGDHIQSSNRHGIVTVASDNGNINSLDVERVMQAAALEIPHDSEIIHSLPRGFIVDGQAGVKRPLGMAGQRLEVETHIVTGKASFLQTAVQCVEQAGFAVEALVLEPIATAAAVTTPDERDMGVILIDIGGGTSDIAVFEEDSIIYSGVLPVGGTHVTRDIAIGLRTPFELAEKIKIKSGAAKPNFIPHGEALEVTMTGSGEKLRIPRSLLGEIIEARMREIYELTRQMMHEAGAQKRLPAGVILTGGGALLPGAIELANEIFQMPTRLGYPLKVEGWSEKVLLPQFSTGVGLCRFALSQRISPSNRTEMPALAAGETRRIWGGIAFVNSDGAAVSTDDTNLPKAEPVTLAEATEQPVTAPEVVAPEEIGISEEAIDEARDSIRKIDNSLSSWRHELDEHKKAHEALYRQPELPDDDKSAPATPPTERIWQRLKTFLGYD